MRRAAGIIVALVVIASAYIYVPTSFTRAGRRSLESDPCARGEGPPTSRFYDGVSRLLEAQKFPGFRARAAELTGKVESACVTAFHDACRAATPASRLAVCEAWSEYLKWRREQGTDVEALLGCTACPVLDSPRP